MKEIFKTLKHQNIKTLKQTLIDFDSCGVPLHPGAGKVHPRVGERRGEPLGRLGKVGLSWAGHCSSWRAREAS